MRRKFGAGLVLAALFAGGTSAQEKRFDAQALVAEAIGTVRPVAMRSAQVDWPRLEAELRAQARGARDTVDMLPVYRRLLDALGDNHSFVQVSEETHAAFEKRHGRELYADAKRPPMTSTFRSREMVEHRYIRLPSRKSVQWVAVPKVFGGERARDYAAHLFMATADVPPSNCGFIVDVRGNTGGNVWPMLTGLSGLLGDGPAGRETRPNGKVVIYADLKAGAAVIVEEGAQGQGQTLMQASTWRSIPSLQARPVAVLTDDATASSGEGVAVAFAGRPVSRRFGQRTAGVSTSNNGFRLSDGVNLVVTVGVMTDRTGRAYADGLAPDEEVAFGPGSPEDPEDAQVEAAKAWLASLPGCAAA